MDSGVYLSIIENEQAQYKITLTSQNRVKDSDSSDFVSGTLTTGEVSISGSNNFDNLANLGGDLSSALGKVGSAFSKGAQLASAGGPSFSTTSKQLTRATWTGSEIPVFSLGITFICLKSGDIKQDVTRKVANIMRYTLPDEVSNFGLLTAPANYGPNNKQGLITMRVGNWLTVRNCLVLSAQFDYSQEVNRDGKPIYAVGQVILKPYQAVTYNEYLKWFRL